MITSVLDELAGGALIGLSASLFLLLNGRIAGISGIFGGLLKPKAGDIGWRAAFIGGLVLAGLIFALTAPEMVVSTSTRSTGIVALAGVIVGFGVRLGNGCTSGHGVCGLSRVSRRSIVATSVFMGTGMLTASLFQLLNGGAG
ncbi:MAG: YeeE/YedE family protein [Deltaproteobacteria bacterium]|nr:MAG: YeeE/YedE family protein [Deltaproteobacteria bacterium]